MKRIILSLSALVFVGVLAYGIGRARAGGIPQNSTLNYTGTLLSYGQPDNSAHHITLNLWNGGSVACTTAPSGTTQAVNGRFTIPLDPSCVTVVHQHPDVQVEVVVDGTSLGQTSLGAVPYSVESETASNAAPGSSLSQLDPPGTVIAYAGQVGGASNVSPPAGWLLCNGQAVSRAQYPALFAVLGTSHGAGDGSTTFNLPDYQGMFLRGVDHGVNRDPDSASRTAMNSGGNTGDLVGSVESAAFASHSHGVNDPGHNHGGSTTGVNNAGGATDAWRDWNVAGCSNKVFNYSLFCNVSSDFNGHTHAIPTGYTGISIQNAGGSETRPVNAYVNYLIKY